MTALWTSAEVAAATGGKASGEWDADGVCIDSRAVSIGDLFVAVEGPKFDGHDFVVEALERGASSAIVTRIPTDGKQTVNEDRLVLVDDTMVALQALARAARARIKGRVAAVTGSVGKTTTKEALTLTLSRQGLAHATTGNLNNHWGVPLSLSRMPQDTDYAVLELGMNHAGEIEPLSKMVRPNVAVITTVEAVHLEFFSSVTDIANAKAEIFTGLESGGIAIIPADNSHYDHLAQAAATAGAEQIVSFGTDNGAAYRLIAWSVSDVGTRIAADVNGKRLVYDIGMMGKHMALNSLAVLATVDALGGDVEQAAGDLNDMTPPTGRGARSTIAIANGSFDLIDESYNASPASIAALAGALNATRKRGRVILALGDMLELGDRSDALHADLATPIATDGIDCVFTAGPAMRHLHGALPSDQSTAHAASAAELVPLITNFVEPGDVVAVKGSFGSHMSVVVDALKELGRHTQSAVNGG
ncbi:MAG: UDP-N-acetylmuramoyl-tripeptide--D-alanyl-D-alanine ligase [Rhodospirillaceae bacterium]|jgi:UDP-N-acetylmuramoyl-tripeptide--D-alanyl-D-alanine ligase|nr:UDP-N-acetylmuramoyl-tripeptide--D-alanyl-D-alanine ligase [Rhodospirillaceae bacterium]MBT5239892.1 UDP-N-acetylmuramoyl-tripeptide--D-alanyl-D-alanine ligase [Rhodospirillaceae bacterium]MBT5565232.1 UDP-N-acetylmuramoyl-tripeptide--D-alanyl-D-alanine ligase [Rhodospirillaceae bacterium]MBT6091090.1 UDP-N-acetylmuramoyl-tripeptide--D-alanyl-D-alanine ligase [Rhodospirillaceae bacterium]MBT6959976.1 UDP-N-acetylmuramoyl-tripeptide--D-alanyl-D-alanine ligase [Rhodospirillaceae bacterium]